jgi:hypothetical protein
MRERLLESLPGYTGPNVLARGKDIEADAVYFTHELEAIIGRWIAVDYQCRPHDGLRVPEAPRLTLSPNEAYEEAVGRAGFLHVPRDPDLHLRRLPVEPRVIGRAGVEIGGLSYDSPALDPYRRQRCPLAAFDGKWPIRADPRELHRVWFHDPADPAGVPQIGAIAGPEYLLTISSNGELDKLDEVLAARQIAWLADLATRLDRVPASQLRQGDPTLGA